jgi:hypothetical protein
MCGDRTSGMLGEVTLIRGVELTIRISISLLAMAVARVRQWQLAQISCLPVATSVNPIW